MEKAVISVFTSVSLNLANTKSFEVCHCSKFGPRLRCRTFNYLDTKLNGLLSLRYLRLWFPYFLLFWFRDASSSSE